MTSDRTIIRKQRAKQPYTCDVCTRWIKSGAVYLRHSSPPGTGEPQTTSWSVVRECSSCATMFGRAGLLEDKA